jgi:predicted PurR-regulated permease PerM
MGIFLFFIAIVLLVVLEFISFTVYWINKGNVKGYWLSTAKDIDKFGNRHFRHLFNQSLIKTEGHQFGNIEETISEVLGINYYNKTLTTTGKIIVFILTKKHCLKAAKLWKNSEN